MAPSSSASDLDSLARAAEALAADPADLEALAAVASGLACRWPDDAAWAFASLADLAKDTGRFALALAAVRSLERLGDADGARRRLVALARAYGAGSPQVDARARVPPPPPRRAGRTEASLSGGAPTAETVRARALSALDAVARAPTQKAPVRLPPVPLVYDLPPEEVERLAQSARLECKQAGDVVVDVDEEARALYLVARGSLSVSRNEHRLATLRAGAFFGEIALLGATRRTARVTALEETWLIEIPRDALEAAAIRSPAVADTLAQFARRRLLSNVMRTAELFRRLDPEERERLVGRFEPLVIDAGTPILREGEAGDRLHVIVSGEVEVRRGGYPIARLVAGDLFGEMSLLGRKPATADVVALTRTVTLSLDRSSFDDVALAHPEVLAEVYKILVEREADQSATHLLVVEDEDVIV